MAKKDKSTKKKAKTGRLKRVALLLESDEAFDRGIARGIGDYIRNHTGWIILMDPMMEVSMEGIQHWKPDGIITSIHLPAIKEVSKLKDIPTVGFGSYSEERDGHLGFPIVTSDQQAIGRMAAQHFMSNGIRHFAFCGGNEKAPWCAQRREGFVDELSEKGFACEIYEPSFKKAVNMPDAVRSLSKWLASLEKPTGVFVFFDGWARWLLDACVIMHINVPQEISVLGVDNDRWLCELSQPMLSSVDVNVRKAGYTAAEQLDRVMRKEAVRPPVTRIAPAQVIVRDSSNFLNFDDPEVAFALRYIREHACDPISTADVLKVTGMSNSTAYRKFMKALGHSIHSEIQNVQMERIKKLLTSTNMSIGDVSKTAGFENVRYLTQVFREETGLTPTEYRRKQSTPDL